MALKPLTVLCYTATVLIVLATVARSAPVEAEEDIQQRNAKTVEHRQQQQQPQQPQQQQGEQLGIAPLVNSLLTSLLRQTLYTRMENLLLDGSSSASSRIPPSEMPPSYPSLPESHPESVRKSGERRRIVDSAVRNYQEQDGGLSQDFTKLAGKSEQMRQSLEDETRPFDFGFVWECTVDTFSKKVNKN